MDSMDSWAVPPEILAHAQRFADSRTPPAVPRRAATVVLLRPADSGFEVYALRRADSMAFAPGMYAFPGGSVDPGDAADEVAWSGPPPEVWASRLGLDAPAARAVVCAAVRELFEESGVLLAGPASAGDRSTVDFSAAAWEQARLALVAREVGLAELLDRHGLALRSELLTGWTRWLTPAFEPRRLRHVLLRGAATGGAAYPPRRRRGGGGGVAPAGRGR
jgi:8-oxo-dGTP pyrophosphatase MutT (NUDIX family)